MGVFYVYVYTRLVAQNNKLYAFESVLQQSRRKTLRFKNSKHTDHGVRYGVYEILLLNLHFLFVPNTSIINWAIKTLNIHFTVNVVITHGDPKCAIDTFSIWEYLI